MRGREGQRPFGTFPKIHPFQYPDPSQKGKRRKSENKWRVIAGECNRQAGAVGGRRTLPSGRSNHSNIPCTTILDAILYSTILYPAAILLAGLRTLRLLCRSEHTGHAHLIIITIIITTDYLHHHHLSDNCHHFGQTTLLPSNQGTAPTHSTPYICTRIPKVDGLREMLIGDRQLFLLSAPCVCFSLILKQAENFPSKSHNFIYDIYVSSSVCSKQLIFIFK